MASQFDQVMLMLEALHKKQDQIINMLEGMGGENDLFGEDPFDESDYIQHGISPDEADAEVIRPRMPGVTRRLVEVRSREGGTKTVPRDQLDPRILRVLDASIKANAIWFLYERDTDGQIMISAEDHIINAVGRGEVPPDLNQPDLTDQPEE